MNKRTLKIPFIFLLLLSISLAAYSFIFCLKQFSFDDDEALDKWNKMILNGEVEYSLIKEGGSGYVQALSDKTCSALYYRVGFSLKEYPLLKWKWKVLKFPDLSTAATDEERDDYAARVYVIFPFLSLSTSRFIEYIWSEDIPVGTVLNSPFGKNIKMIVARKGAPEGEEWISESRNVYEDYIKAFGKEPHMRVGAIAIMCDADGTKTSAESLFDDIVIEKGETL